MHKKNFYFSTFCLLGLINFLLFTSLPSLASDPTFHEDTIEVKSAPPSRKPEPSEASQPKPQAKPQPSVAPPFERRVKPTPKTDNEQPPNTTTPDNQRSADKSLISVKLFTADKVSVGVPFPIDITYEAKDERAPKSIFIRMDKTGIIKYEPSEFSLNVNSRISIQATVITAASGLAMIKAEVEGATKELSVPIDAGFAPKLKTKDLDEKIESGSIQNFTIELVDDDEKPIQAGAAIKLKIVSSKALLRLKGSAQWSDTIETEIRRGATSTQIIELQPQWVWSGTQGLLTATVTLIDRTNTNPEDSAVLFDRKIEKLNIIPPSWVPLGAAIIGGMLFSLYQVSQELVKNKQRRRQSVLNMFVSKIAPGALAGALAYFLANWKVLGFQIDTTALHGFIVLGFLFSYVGIDTILKLVATPKD
jgi:hypothetical protein